MRRGREERPDLYPHTDAEVCEERAARPRARGDVTGAWEKSLGRCLQIPSGKASSGCQPRSQ